MVNISWHCTVAGICICVCVLMLCFLFASSVGGYVVQGKLHCYYFCCVVLCYVAHVCVVTAVSIYGLIGPLSRLTLLFDFWNAEILCAFPL